MGGAGRREECPSLTLDFYTAINEGQRKKSITEQLFDYLDEGPISNLCIKCSHMRCQVHIQQKIILCRKRERTNCTE